MDGLVVRVEEVRLVDMVDSKGVEWFAGRVAQKPAASWAATAVEGEEGH
jgi:hypothetical protein